MFLLLFFSSALACTELLLGAGGGRLFYLDPETAEKTDVRGLPFGESPLAVDLTNKIFLANNGSFYAITNNQLSRLNFTNSVKVYDLTSANDLVAAVKNESCGINWFISTIDKGTGEITLQNEIGNSSSVGIASDSENNLVARTHNVFVDIVNGTAVNPRLCDVPVNGPIAFDKSDKLYAIYNNNATETFTLYIVRPNGSTRRIGSGPGFVSGMDFICKQNEPEQEDQGISTSAIVGLVITAVGVAVAVLVILALQVRRERRWRNYSGLPNQ